MSAQGKDEIAHGRRQAGRCGGNRPSRFELAPPRRFILPAILLLLSEHSGYGYGLVPRLEEFHFGHVDRPAVYRALAQLETDGLVEAAVAEPQGRLRPGASTGSPHSVSGSSGSWMGVIKEEHDYLGQALRRYQATGTIDAVLAEVEGGWSSASGAGWSPVSSTSGGWRRPAPAGVRRGRAQEHAGPADCALESDRTETAELSSFQLDPERSAVLIDVRSTVGPLSFGTLGVDGHDPCGLRGRRVAHRHPTVGPPDHRRLRAQLR